MNNLAYNEKAIPTNLHADHEAAKTKMRGHHHDFAE
jgi:hypothetical protein